MHMGNFYGKLEHYSRVSDKALRVVPVLCVAYFTYLAADLQVDDALIYLRYVRNFQDGFGLTYNPGEYFNGLTSPLNTALLVASSVFFSNLQIAMILLSGIFLAGAALLGGGLLSNGKFERAFCSSAIACFGYFYSTFGMESTLFLFLIALSLWLYRKESPYFLISLSLLICTRSEGIFLALVLGGDYLHRHRKLPDWRFPLVAFLLFCLPFVFNFIYYGALLPATGTAKIAQGQSGLWGERWIFLSLYYFPQAFFSNSLFAPLFLGFMALAGLFFVRRNREVWLYILFLTLLLIFYTALNIPNYHWYYAPFFYFLIIFACHGLWRLCAISLSKGLVSKRSPAFALLLIGSLACAHNIVSFEKRGVNQTYVDMGEWLHENTAETASVAMVEIGAIGWYSHRTIIDILGLVNLHNAGYLGERRFMHWLLHYQPDYIIRHEPVWSHEQSIPPLEELGLYVRVDDASSSGLVLLERAPGVSQQAVKQAVSARIEEAQTLQEMLASSETGAPYVLLQGTSLFAHAPSSLRLNVEEPIESLEIGFGIRETAQGLHERLCFEVRTESAATLLLQHCIEPDAPLEAMHIERSIHTRVGAEETLLFDTRCDTSCDYAWTYWSRVVMRKVN